MKKYINPEITVIAIKTKNLMQATSITSVNGLDGVSKAQGDFEGGVVDTKERGDYDNGSWSDGLW